MITISTLEKWLDFSFSGESPIRKANDKIFVTMIISQRKRVIVGFKFGKTESGEFVESGQEFNFTLTKTNAELDAYTYANAQTDARAFLIAKCNDPLATFTIN